MATVTGEMRSLFPPSNHSRFDTKPTPDAIHCLIQQLRRMNENESVCLESRDGREKDVRFPRSGRGFQDTGGIPEQIVEGLFLEVVELAFGRKDLCFRTDNLVNDLELNTLRSQSSDDSREISTGQNEGVSFLAIEFNPGPFLAVPETHPFVFGEFRVAKLVFLDEYISQLPR